MTPTLDLVHKDLLWAICIPRLLELPQEHLHQAHFTSFELYSLWTVTSTEGSHAQHANASHNAAASHCTSPIGARLLLHETGQINPSGTLEPPRVAASCLYHNNSLRVPCRVVAQFGLGWGVAGKCGTAAIKWKVPLACKRIFPRGLLKLDFT